MRPTRWSGRGWTKHEACAFCAWGSEEQSQLIWTHHLCVVKEGNWEDEHQAEGSPRSETKGHVIAKDELEISFFWEEDRAQGVVGCARAGTTVIGQEGLESRRREARPFLNGIECFSSLGHCPYAWTWTWAGAWLSFGHIVLLHLINTYRITCRLFLMPVYCTQLLNTCTLASGDREGTARPVCFVPVPVPQSYSQSGIDELVSCFNSACTSGLHTIAPGKECWPKPRSHPWFNDNTHS